MEPSRSTMNLHMEMEGHICAMRAAMNVMEDRKKDKVVNMPNGSTARIRLVDEGAMDLKTKIGDQVQVISDVGRRYKAAEVNAQSLEAEIKSLETTAMKTKRLMDVAEKAQLAAKAAKDRARILAEHVTIAVSAEAGKMESSGGSESHDAADSVQTALMTMKAARAATVALEALDTSLEASREVSALTTARISNKRRELALIAKDKDAYHGLLKEEVHVGKALLDIANGNRPGEGTKSLSAAGASSDKMEVDTDGAVATSAPESGSSNAVPSGQESPRASTSASASPSLSQTSRSLINSPSVVNIAGHKYFIQPHPESKAAAARPVKATTSGGISVAMANAKIAF